MHIKYQVTRGCTSCGNNTRYWKLAVKYEMRSLEIEQEWKYSSHIEEDKITVVGTCAQDG